jgi:hypothetical protein
VPFVEFLQNSWIALTFCDQVGHHFPKEAVNLPN